MHLAPAVEPSSSFPWAQCWEVIHYIFFISASSEILYHIILPHSLCLINLILNTCIRSTFSFYEAALSFCWPQEGTFILFLSLSCHCFTFLLTWYHTNNNIGVPFEFFFLQSVKFLVETSIELQTLSGTGSSSNHFTRQRAIRFSVNARNVPYWSFNVTIYGQHACAYIFHMWLKKFHSKWNILPGAWACSDTVVCLSQTELSDMTLDAVCTQKTIDQPFLFLGGGPIH